MRLILLYIISLILLNSSYAEVPDSKVINKFKIYLKEIKSLAVDFTQTDSKGYVTTGKLLINKPYKFRCNYYPPFPLVIIGNKNYVSVYDYDMKNLSRMKSTDNIFNFLLTDSDFDKHFQIESAQENANYIIVKFYHDVSERSSQITFDKTTNQIHSIEVFEDNNIINIVFDKVLKVQRFNEDLFHIRNPDVFGPPVRLNKNQIEQMLLISSY